MKNWDIKRIAEEIMRLKNVLIVVNDIEKSKAFYQHLFGLQVLCDGGETAILTEGLVLQDATVWRSTIEGNIAWNNYASMLYFEEPNIEIFIQKLEAYEEFKGYVNPPCELDGGQRMLRVFDLDGNLIEVRTPR